MEEGGGEPGASFAAFEQQGSAGAASEHTGPASESAQQLCGAAGQAGVWAGPGDARGEATEVHFAAPFSCPAAAPARFAPAPGHAAAEPAQPSDTPGVGSRCDAARGAAGAGPGEEEPTACPSQQQQQQLESSSAAGEASHHQQLISAAADYGYGEYTAAPGPDEQQYAELGFSREQLDSAAGAGGDPAGSGLGGDDAEAGYAADGGAGALFATDGGGGAAQQGGYYAGDDGGAGYGDAAPAQSGGGEGTMQQQQQDADAAAAVAPAASGAVHPVRIQCAKCAAAFLRRPLSLQSSVFRLRRATLL